MAGIQLAEYMAYHSFVLIPEDPNVTVDTVRRRLEAMFANDYAVVEFDVEESELKITIDGWPCRILLDRSDACRREIAEMAEKLTPDAVTKRKIVQCRLRLEINAGDDPTGEFFNDFLLITEELARIPGAVIWEEASAELTVLPQRATI